MPSSKPLMPVAETLPTGFDLESLRQLMRDAGCRSLYAKRLSANDNNKNQPYFATRGELRVFNILPVKAMHPHRNTRNEESFIADIDFAWLDPRGGKYPAPRTKLILYPQYPEVRFSGFLEGSGYPAGDLMRYSSTHSLPERILFLGVTSDRRTYGFVTLASSPIARQYDALGDLPLIGVFREVPLSPELDPRAVLCRELHRIHRLGWLDAITMRRTPEGAWERVPCHGTRCGGCTIETELGIPPNGIAEPDFAGWEVKQHGVSSFTKTSSGVITLFTPEPQAGLYQTEGVIPFIRKYGYPDQLGRPNRTNFGGIYRVGTAQARTKLVLALDGFDALSGAITNPAGGIVLRDPQGEAAAIWPFAGLLEHWNRKHARAVYVPSVHRCPETVHQYWYGDTVRLAEETDFLWFLKAMAAGNVYLDPALKLENADSAHPKAKRRNQFRIRASEIGRLYRTVSVIDVKTY